MPQNKQILFFAFLFTTLSLGLVWEFYPLPDAKDRLATIAANGISFSSKELPLTAFENSTLDGANAMKRIYAYQNCKYLMTFTDGSKNRNAVHDPTYCYLGDGWKIETTTTVELENGTAQKLTLTRDNESTELLYWFNDGQAGYHSILRYWLQTTLRRITLGNSSEEPILVLMRPLDKSHTDWHSVIHHLIPMLGI